MIDDPFELEPEDPDDDLRDPATGRFTKGVSGNPKGRPKKVELVRAMSNRGYRRDVLSVTEELIVVETADGPRRVPYHVANLMAVRSKASRGHAPSQRYLDKIHREAVAAHEKAHPKQFKIVEEFEQMIFDDPRFDTDATRELINRYRSLTRRP